MTEPTRWRDDPEQAPEGMVELLERVGPARAMPAGVRGRSLARATRLAALPAAAGASWLGLKTAVAAVAAGAVAATAAAVVLPERAPSPPAPAKLASATPSKPAAVRRVPRRGTFSGPLPAPSADAPAPDPEPEPAAPGVLRPPAPTGTGAAPQSASIADFGAQATDALAAETRLLESARAALASAPGRALQITREHAARFPAGRLSAERSIIEIDALLRLGRRAEARARAERLLIRSPKSLYAERVRRLLGESVD